MQFNSSIAGARGPKHPVDSEVSTLIIALPRWSWSVRARLSSGKEG